MTVSASPSDLACRIASERWGLDAKAEELVGWADSNFLLRTSDGRRYVLKISPSGIKREALTTQLSALLHLTTGELAPLVPGVVPTLGGRVVAKIEEIVDGPRWARLLTYLEGTPLVRIQARPPELLTEIGRTLAKLDVELSGFDHSGAHKTHQWDLLTSTDLARFSHHIDGLERRGLVEAHLDRFAGEVVPRRDELEHGVIHNDANDYNLLVSMDEDGPRLSGIIDFGDLLSTAVISELAIALAYLMLDREDPLADAGAVISGFHAERPLPPLEQELLPSLVLARLCASVLNSAHARHHDPDNVYLQISDAPMWRLLERFGSTEEFLTTTVEAACR